jgi:manganese/zinc/iron transport system substrate-binding protein
MGGPRTNEARPGGRHAAGAAALRRGAAVLAVALSGGLAAGGCGSVETGGDGEARLRVVATTGIVADLAERVGGDRVVVQGLMGPGVDPHGYKARAGDVRRLAGADLVLYNGLHLEAAMSEVLEAMGRRARTVAVTEWIDRSRLLSPPEFEGNWDPHVWFDVRLWMRAVERVAAALADADPAGSAAYRARAAEYVLELEALDGWVRARAGELPAERRVLVTAHDAFNYFGRAYGFEVKGLQGISTQAEAGTGDVQRLAAEIAARRIPAIFVETSVPPRTIEAVQAAVASRGFRVVIGPPLYSDALGDAGTPAGTYAGMVRHNVEGIVRALGAAPAAAGGGT